MRIDPRQAVPQAPRTLRAGSKGAARAAAAALAGKDPPEPADDDDEDEDDEDEDEDEDSYGLDDHEPLRAAAEQAHLAAADAYAKCKATDSAAALMHAEEMGDAATEAHDAAKASSMKLRGAEPQDAAPSPAPGPAAAPSAAPPGARVPVASLARAIAAAGGTADAQAKIAATIAFADRMGALFGGATLDETEGLARAAHQDAAEAVGLRAAAVKAERAAKKRAEKDAEAALVAKLGAAVRAGKYARAELFDVTEASGADGKPVEVLAPQAWTRAMAPAALDAMIAKKQARVGATGAGGGPLLPDETPVHISAGLDAYCAARGITDPAEKAKLAAALTRTAGAAAQPEEHR